MRTYTCTLHFLVSLQQRPVFVFTRKKQKLEDAASHGGHGHGANAPPPNSRLNLHRLQTLLHAVNFLTFTAQRQTLQTFSALF